MIEIKDKTLERISNWEDDTIYIVTDFDKTLTLGSSSTSWSILSKSNLVPSEYIKERQELYDYYRPIEIDETLDLKIKSKLIREWFKKHLDLLVKYKLSEDVINYAAKNLRVMSFRDGAKEFLENMYKRNIPVIIISAGIGNFIEQFLIKNNCMYSNIFIVSNFIKFKDGIASGVINDNLIHSLNKNEVSLPSDIKELIKLRENIILLGDNISDIKMVNESKQKDALKIGFLEENIEVNLSYFKKEFDVVCTNNTGYNELSEKINILKK